MNLERILIIKWSAMGDVALASTVMEDVVQAYPDAEIDLNTLPPCDRLFAHDPRFAHVYTYNVRAKRGSWKEMRRWLRTVRERRYDMIIDLQTTDRSRVLIALLCLLGGAPKIRLGNNPGFPYTAHASRPDGVRSALALMRATVASGGIPNVTERPVLHAGAEAEARVEAMVAEESLNAGDFAVFMPGSQAAGYLKRWGVENYAGLARRMLARRWRKVVLIGGPDEIADCEAIAQRVGRGVLNLCGKTQLLDIAPICEHANVIVANDTGTAHIGAASGRPMVVICGPTDPRRVRPAGERVTTLQADLACINCYRKHCGHHSCMRIISPEDVLEHIVAREPDEDIQNGGRRASDSSVV
ncbi:MAG: glycosyltransferase family 9 protein [Pseudomonadota bacterium]